MLRTILNLKAACRTLMRWLFIIASYESGLLPTFIQSAGSMLVVGSVCIADGNIYVSHTGYYNNIEDDTKFTRPCD